ncbi:hypothetical protein ACTFIW_000457 [Dictyostelium discoideum]
MDKYLMSPSFLCNDQREYSQDYFQGCFSNFHNNNNNNNNNKNNNNNTYYQKEIQNHQLKQNNYYNQNLNESYQNHQQQFIYNNNNNNNNGNFEDYSQNEKSNNQFILIDESLIEACKDAIKTKDIEEIEEIDEEGIPIIDVPVTNSIFYRNNIK